MRPSADASPFHAIADPTRRDLLTMLRCGERSASELAAPFATSRSAVSQHLGILLESGLVERTRDGRRQLYRLRPQPLREVVNWMDQFDAFWDDRLARLGHHLDGDR